MGGWRWGGTESVVCACAHEFLVVAWFVLVCFPRARFLAVPPAAAAALYCAVMSPYNNIYLPP